LRLAGFLLRRSISALERHHRLALLAEAYHPYGDGTAALQLQGALTALPSLP
jgi:hypothetical protein